VGGAIGVAVIGSLMSTRYRSQMTLVLGHHLLTATLRHTIFGSLGEALATASRLGGALGEFLARAARTAFLNGADLGLVVGSAVAMAGCVLVLLALPAHVADDTVPSADVDTAQRRALNPPAAG